MLLDPIGGFSRIKDFFISYVETSFRISNPDVAKSRKDLLNSPGVLATQPFIEPVLRYKSYQWRLEEMIDKENGPLESLSLKARYAFVELALSGLFEGQLNDGFLRRKSLYAPYQHQVDMLRRGLQAGSPGIVTSGTGSGKTESFMLPVLAAIANEAVNWPSPDKGFLKNDWWNNDNPKWIPQRAGENRASAVRALILYPMNALVDDQMVRLRKTLDSDDARSVMDERFSGNRVFFGQYTSSTPVTGYECHPRTKNELDEKKRRARRLKRLCTAMQAFQRDQDAARKHDELSLKEFELNDLESNGKPIPDKTRYIFPSVDGGEMVSRWDMHVNPPDILVTNASMLGAMLSREVEDSIFEKTKEWIVSNDDAFFYIIIDELHLIRGSAGTEVAFLLKSLFERLGLDQPEHMYKLRILASSASLPMDGDRGIQSRTYLRDLFAPFGTSKRKGCTGSIDADYWAECVIQGQPNLPSPVQEGKLDPEPFSRLMRIALAGHDGFVSKIIRSSELDIAIKDVAVSLGVKGNNDSDLIRNLSVHAAALLTNACLTDQGVRATSTIDLSNKLFGKIGADFEMALRGLMLVRALPESTHWQARVESETPSFRVHTFIRNIEGLFAAPSVIGKSVRFTGFTVERGTSHAQPMPGEKRGRRLFELLYCEACGDLFIGGQRGQKTGLRRDTELLPSAADLEGLPERAAPEYYDSMNRDEYAVFWPRTTEPERDEKDYDSWSSAYLNLETGIVVEGQKNRGEDLQGFLYYQTDKAVPKNRIAVPSAQPFCCPKCGTDYSNRPVSNRSRTPIRAFRTGVTKASQLVATELFELLHAIGADPKGIAFSDSRQDAANQALEIERLHLRDLRRESLVATARSWVVQEKNKMDSRLTFDEYLQLRQQLSADTDARKLLDKRWKEQPVDLPNADSVRKVRLDNLLSLNGRDSNIGELVAELIRLGIHPFDESGIAGINREPWYKFFDLVGDKVGFLHKISEAERSDLSNKILNKQYELIDDVIFANTFFALEETGLAYPSISIDGGEEVDRLDGWLRAFAGSYRIKNNRYVSGDVKEWVKGSDVTSKRLRRLAEKHFGVEASNEGLTEVLSNFDRHGHKSGLFEIGSLFLNVAEPEDPYWRCLNCERVHMHIGFGKCTRCGQNLSSEKTGIVRELWNNNFLGRRIVRSHNEGIGRFRMRVEELTGQTNDFSDRLRKFKGIFVDGESEMQRRATEIDMLSVTTTMEVGIDIGALQSVYQANMPPQRFNYQQRVGRAGRRGQAFSFVATFCRGRSHDAYYFAHPEAITGDPPPPPFLAVEHDDIPRRLLNKVWLRAAFKYLRDECASFGKPYPGDSLVPPDVHGEFITTSDYYHDTQEGWQSRLKEALEKTIGVRNNYAIAALYSVERRHRLLSKSGIDDLLKRINSLSDKAPPAHAGMGLAQFLAEWGVLPMYGMPTRVRELYLGLTEVKSGPDLEFEWSTMDRDLDLAVFEFAPGAILVKDKQKHRVVGFTGHLADPQRYDSKTELKVMSDWLESSTHVAICPACGSAKHNEVVPQEAMRCSDCDAEIPIHEFREYITPVAFRTDFDPKTQSDDVGRMSTRTVATVLHDGESVKCGCVSIRRGAGVTIMQLNDGISDDEGCGQRFTVSEAQDLKVQKPFNKGAPFKIADGQMIDLSVLQQKAYVNRWARKSDSQLEFGLIARKETDALYLQLDEYNPRLSLNMVARKGEFEHLPTRAAAISATQILVQKAALMLDVSADEFEALEPRLRSGRPMLQIADALINGSGLCRRLGEAVTDGRPPQIIELIKDILSNKSAWPLQDFLRIDGSGKHDENCNTSCYRCIQRYGNRRYHSLLDWRLGLSYLRAMIEPNYSCGLSAADNKFPEIKDWRRRAYELAESVAEMRKGTLTYSTLPNSNLPLLTDVDLQTGSMRAQIVVVHPLWRVNPDDSESMMSLLGKDWVEGMLVVDTFNLERRPLRELARLRG